MKKHQKFLSIIFAVVIICCMNSCQTSTASPTINDSPATQAQTQAQTQAPQKEVIKLTKDNISDYLKIDYSFDNAVMKHKDKYGETWDCDFSIKTTPLKRGDFENVTIKLSFTGTHGWSDYSTEIDVPFDGKYEQTNDDPWGYSAFVSKTPRFELESIEVTGEFVKS